MNNIKSKLSSSHEKVVSENVTHLRNQFLHNMKLIDIIYVIVYPTTTIKQTTYGMFLPSDVPRRQFLKWVSEYVYELKILWVLAQLSCLFELPTAYMAAITVTRSHKNKTPKVDRF